MNRGPLKGVSRTDFRTRAELAWAPAPDWILSLADACNATSQSLAAKRVGYSAATISQVLSCSYAGDLNRVEEMVRGALMESVVACPILGEIGRDRCLQEQDEPFRATSSMRAQLWQACHGGCPFSKHTKAFRRRRCMLNDRKIVRPTPRTQQLQESLSRRLTAMAASLTNKRDTGTVMAPEDISALTDSVRALVRDARILEGDSVAPMINPAIPEAFWLVTRAETEIGLARSAIRDRLEEAESDPEGRIRRRLNGIIAMVEQADNLIAGRGKTQS